MLTLKQLFVLILYLLFEHMDLIHVLISLKHILHIAMGESDDLKIIY